MSGSCFQESKRIVKRCSLMVCIVCALSELYAGNVPVFLLPFKIALNAQYFARSEDFSTRCPL